MEPVRLLLVTSRRGVRSLFDGPPGRELPAFSLLPLPMDAAAVETATDEVRAAAVAIVDLAPNPTLAVHVCRQLRSREPPLPVIALTCCAASITDHHVEALVDMGVGGVLDLSGGRGFLIRAVRSVLQGEWVVRLDTPGPQSETFAAFMEMGRGRRRQPQTQLTNRERAVLRLLLAGQSRNAIARAENLSPRTLSRAVARLQEKLDVRSEVALGAKAVLLGYLP